jgi:O-antigen ligase
MVFIRQINFNRTLGNWIGFLLVLSVSIFFWNELLTRWLSGVVIFFGSLWFIIRGREFFFFYPVIILFVTLILEVITWLLLINGHPILGDGKLKLDVLMRVFVFIPFGWILYKNEKYVTTFIFSVVFGAAFMCFTHPESIEQLRNYLIHYQSPVTNRADFGYSNPEFLGFFSGFSLIILVFFANRFYKLFINYRYFFFIGYFFIALMLLICLLAAQTRAAFLGLLVTSIFSILSWFYYLFKIRNKKHISLLAGLFIPLLVVLLVLFSFGKVWHDRSIEDAPAFNEMKKMNFNKIPETSVGMRIYIWKAAIPAIRERPFFGWGHDGSVTSLNQSSIPKYVIQQTGHYHNTVLDLIVRQGIIAFALILSVYFWIAFQIIGAYRRGNVPIDFLMFFFAFMIYFAITNQFESYLLYTAGAFSSNIVLGLAIYYLFKDREV